MTDIHIMHLNSPWFEFVRDGKKLYEGRRRTPKILQLKPNDIINIKHYTKPDVEEPYRVCIENILYFPTFEDALKSLPLHDVLPIDDITIEKSVEIYQQYVSLQTQEKDGIVMIKIKRCD